jgi:hypothetical protein
MNIRFTILNDPGETAHPVAEDALHVIKSEVISHHRNCFFDFVTRGKLLILEASFQHAKEPTVTWTYVWRIRWVRHSEKTVLTKFRLDL